MQLGLHLPINSVSFGQVSTLILRTLHDRQKAGQEIPDLFLFPISQIDFASQTALPQDFQSWMQGMINRAFESYKRDIPIFKLWHLNGSLESFSKSQTLLTFYELDNPTKIEQNIAQNNRLCLTNKYAQAIFKMFGIDSHLIPLAFDSYNFRKLDKKFHTDDRIVFNICGKFENRKRHAKAIQAWIKKFGNNPKYFLQCATYNVHLNEQQNNQVIQQILQGPKPFNVNFFPMMRENLLYNDFLNSADIILGVSGAEGWGLPEFHSIALGKHAVLVNAHAYQTWATPEMAEFLEPVGKIPAADGMFFQNGGPFNQGNIFDWDENAFVAACEAAVKKVEANRVNEAGLTLQETYSKDKFVDSILALYQ